MVRTSEVFISILHASLELVSLLAVKVNFSFFGTSTELVSLCFHIRTGWLIERLFRSVAKPKPNQGTWLSTSLAF